MGKKEIYLGSTCLNVSTQEIKGQIIDIEGEKYYKISNYNLMSDFFITIVSNSDHWMFISSNGSLSAGRRNRNNALFPYYSDDKIHDYRNKTGSRTICLVSKNNLTYLWEPFADDHEKIYRLERNLYKSTFGNKIIFEEINFDLEVCFQYGWYNSEKFGWVKKSSLFTGSISGINIQILDGISNILPCGVDYAFQNEYSNLLEAYRKNELLPESKMGLFLLSSIPVDTAEPSEALKANTAWCVLSGKNAKFLLSDKQLERFKTGEELNTEAEIFALRGGYYINTEYKLKKGEKVSWYIVADVNKDSTDVVNLDSYIRKNQNLDQKIEEDIAAGTSNLLKIVAGADGLQMGNDELINSRHFSNTLFNVMRGGVFSDSYRIDVSDFSLFVKQCNTEVSEHFKEDLQHLPDKINYDELVYRIKNLESADLERICYEYLPLTFSRRHGDPSRPWNQFSIETKMAEGSIKLDYQGNWRDIFQNWEALTISYPGYIESIICKFVNASTADGYNPYRIARKGIDWECPDPLDPWAYIGYWGDHQLIYLQKFLEQSNNYHPGKIEELLTRKIFVYANVPYRIKTIDRIIDNPKDTIVFDTELNRQIEAITAVKGSDGKLLTRKAGGIYRVNLMEKILCSLLSKLSNFIPEAGIWLITQRPEWNDANNALVGNGTSMVTLCYLRRSLFFWKTKLVDTDISSFDISEEVKTLFEDIFSIFSENYDLVNQGFSDRDRYCFALQLGKAGSDYREKIYRQSFSGKTSLLGVEQLKEFMQISIDFIDQSIKKNRRIDGLYHSYNLISFNKESISIRFLYEMLEGQVAVLSSGLLGTNESLTVLDALRASKLYRCDQESYLLYPYRELQKFIEKNIIPGKKVAESELLQLLLLKKDTSILTEDITGNYHFNGTFRNETILSQALEKLDMDLYGELVHKEKALILNLYEAIFDHQSFTGRSGTFYGYEGLGSIYWHMVSKLLLATQETYLAGEKADADINDLIRIRDHYNEIKNGLGIHKSPSLHGAFPVDPYSHTPGGAGAKQPGLTGQVKEDIISRFGEIGILIEKGTIVLSPSLLNPKEMLDSNKTFRFIDREGNDINIKLNNNQFAFTICQVPIIYSKGLSQQITIEYKDGEQKLVQGCVLDEETSQKIFRRTGEVKRIDFTNTFK